ncbi:MAG: SDR family NAD(P)-dependent oxidoreductase [Pseudomonadota bacterium]|nr:SDR family NAD(P)-dependent oxidoreductase [Pseudomonadota bacterium]
MTGRLNGRIALVTGASRGIGRAVALRFAEEGAHLILTARTVGGLEEVDDLVRGRGGNATLVPMDLSQVDEIDRLGAAIHQRFGRLDVLVANAAMLGVLSPVGHIEPLVWDETIRLNLTSNYRIIRSLDPLLRQSEAGRAIFVTSGAARGKAFWGAYAATKAGLESLVKCYAKEMENTNIRVNLLSPGATRTGMRASAFPGENPKTIKMPESIASLFLELAETSCNRHGEILEASN